MKHENETQKKLESDIESQLKALKQDTESMHRKVAENVNKIIELSIILDKLRE